MFGQWGLTISARSPRLTAICAAMVTPIIAEPGTLMRAGAMSSP